MTHEKIPETSWEPKRHEDLSPWWSRIPAAVWAMILINLLTLAYFAGTQHQQIIDLQAWRTNYEQRITNEIAKLEAKETSALKIESIEKSVADMSLRMARMEEFMYRSNNRPRENQ